MADQPNSSDEYPRDDQIVESPAEAAERAKRDKEVHDDQKAAAAVAATGVGCLATIFSPWLAMIAAAVIFAIAYVIHHWHS